MQVRLMKALEGIVLAAGVGLRLEPFLTPRPLWLDEAMLANNILTRSPGEMFGVLANRQMAPLGFLWGEWFVKLVAGTGERALRFLPLVAGSVALFVFARAARRFLDPGPALLATAIAAMSPLLIYYSAEVKSYAFDWLGAVLLLAATLAVIEKPSRRAWIRWSLVASFSALFSTAAPFFIAGSAIALLAASPVFRSPRALRSLVAAGLPPAGIFALQLLTTYHSSVTADFMRTFWTTAFLTPNLSGIRHGVEWAREFAQALLFGVEPPRKILSVVLASSLVGVISLGRRSRQVAILLVPVMLAMIASLATWWPLTPRLLLFAAPLVCIALPAGLAAVSSTAPRTAQTPLFVALSFALLAVIVSGFPRALRPPSRNTAVPDALQYVGSRAGENATVYVSADLAPSCFYYLKWHPDRHQLRGNSSATNCSLKGVQTVIGKWATFVGAGDEGAIEVDNAWKDFAESEARLILERPAAEVWLMIGTPRLKRPLMSVLEVAGATRVAVQEMPGVTVLQYRER